jgi:predicted porin
VFSQEVAKPDFNTWSSIELGYKLNSRLSFELQQQLRLKENSSTVDTYFSEFSSKYKLIKNFELGVGLRYFNKNDNQGKIQGYEQRFRYNFDGTYSYKVGKFDLSHRFRYQNRQDLNTEDPNYNQVVRFKTGIDYNISKWKLDPEFSAEIFSPVNNPDEKGLNKYRLTLGTAYKMGDFGKLKVFGAVERPLGNGVGTFNILGIGYSYTFKNKK